ncbi:MAG: pyridoxamine 5'-phosphate oxidase family protein [Filomicrobium sp.]
MGHKFQEIAFTETVKSIQEQLGSRRGYSRREGGDSDFNNVLGPQEAGFIGDRDSFYMASVSETGWPYVQHRGGPNGFVRVLDEKTIGFVDYSGNRQYVSVGNLINDDRVSLFFMDYPNRTRLKLLARARIVAPEETEILTKLTPADNQARIERGFLMTVEAFDWNCPQHITPRFTTEQVAAAITPLRNRIAELESKLQKEASPN